MVDLNDRFSRLFELVEDKMVTFRDVSFMLGGRWGGL